MYAGIDIGGTFIKYALVDEAFHIQKKWKKATGFHTECAELYDWICEDLKAFSLDTIGVSIPGVVNEKGSIMSKAAESIWPLYQSDAKVEIEKRLQVVTHAINDAKAAGYYESRYGNAAHTNTSITIVLGTGIGGCLCYGTQVLMGKDGFAGEVSSLPYRRQDGLFRWCDVASVSALCKRYTQASQQICSGEAICERYRSGEIQAKDIVKQWVYDLCVGLVSLAVMYDPDVICIGGGISQQNWLIEEIASCFYQECKTFTQCDLITTKILACATYNDTNLLGAITYARSLIV